MDKDMIQTAQLYGTETEPNPQAGRVYSAEGISPTLDAMRGGNRMPKVIDDTYANRPPREYEEAAPTLRSERDGLKVDLGSEDNLRIRKLTPKECFRLQGFSDELFERASFVNSDSQLYKQAGNAVTVNVIETVGKKIKEGD